MMLPDVGESRPAMSPSSVLLPLPEGPMMATNSLAATSKLMPRMIFLAATQRPATQDSRPVILAFGDSLTAGYGVPRGAGYPERLQQKLDSLGYKYRVVGMGISGDTTSGGRARMKVALAAKPTIVILELGANDGLRGLPIAQTQA